jgi:DNA-binding NarL/FixJ family response regulator
MECGIPQELLELRYEGTPPTREELRLLRLLSKGYTVKSAATVMGKGWSTTKRQMQIVRARLGAETHTQAVAIAVRKGLIP